jgi:hypothetical protein
MNIRIMGFETLASNVAVILKPLKLTVRHQFLDWRYVDEGTGR